MRMRGTVVVCVAVAQDGAGTVTPVSLQGCEIGCEMAQPACTSFAYNPTLQQCFLKTGGQPATCTSQPTPCYEANQNLQARGRPSSNCAHPQYMQRSDQ
jgi:hypothetical protein